MALDKVNNPQFLENGDIEKNNDDSEFYKPVHISFLLLESSAKIFFILSKHGDNRW